MARPSLFRRKAVAETGARAESLTAAGSRFFNFNISHIPLSYQRLTAPGFQKYVKKCRFTPGVQKLSNSASG